MSFYDHNEFMYPVPKGYTIPKGTQVYRRESAPHRVETFFTALYDYPVSDSDEVKFYLTYDITKKRNPQ